MGRSNALFVTRLTAPASESAGFAGVGTLVTSIREMLFSARVFMLNVRPGEAFAETIEAPSDVNAVIEPPMPRTEAPTISTSLYSIAMPGMNFRNSPTLLPSTSPSSSVAITFFRFGAKRCSLVASARASVSRSEATVNRSSFTTEPVPSPWRARLVSAKSRTTDPPPRTATDAVCGSRSV